MDKGKLITDIIYNLNKVVECGNYQEKIDASRLILIYLGIKEGKLVTAL